jgi:hypothetical protein
MGQALEPAHMARGGDHKNGKNYSQVSVMPPAMMIPDPKKSQNKKRFRLRERGTWPCGARFLRLLF